LAKQAPKCPVSGSGTAQTLLQFQDCPLFQHPVPNAAGVEDVRYDLTFLYCPVSGHVYQETYRQDLLEKLYQNFYYTPRPAHIGTSLRDRFEGFFRNVIKRENMEKRKLKVLEIASSAGEVIEDLYKDFPHFSFTGYEPSDRTGADAVAKGIETIPEFFGKESASRRGRRYDVIFARHLIEHIFDFDDFFAGLDHAAADDAVLIYETPALDYFMGVGSLDPFHIEHIHIFSCHSLAMLGERFGWHVLDYEVSEEGNILMAFKKHITTEKHPSLPSTKTVPLLAARQEQLRKARASATKGRKFYIWGAGSYGRSIYGLMDTPPEMFLDGNPNKSGYKFIGVDLPIGYAPDVIKDIISRKEDTNSMILIASTYYNEIRRDLEALGWKGGSLVLSEVK